MNEGTWRRAAHHAIPHTAALILGTYDGSDLVWLDMSDTPPPEPSPAILAGGVFSDPEVEALVAEVQTVDDGGFRLPIDGTVRGLRADFSAVANAADIAATINANLSAYARAEFDAGRLIIATLSTGSTASIGFASANAIGADLSETLRLTEAAGATITQGTDG